jgi:hypothetical protein
VSFDKFAELINCLRVEDVAQISGGRIPKERRRIPVRKFVVEETMELRVL